MQRILLVESDPALRQTLSRAMFGLDLVSDGVGDAAEALDRLMRQPYAIVLLDLAIAGGFDAVIAAVQKMPRREQPIILGTVESDGIARIDAEGVQVVIRRPLDVPEVAEMLRACIDVMRSRNVAGTARPRDLETRLTQRP